MNKILKILNSLLFIFFICFMVYMLISSYNTLGTSKILLVLCIFPLIMLPYILDRLRIHNMDEILIFVYYIFLLLSLILGSILGFYHKIWWFDLLCHFMSGCLTTVVSIIILDKYKLIDKKYRVFGIIFIIIFTVGIAALWEYFEFTIDKLSGNDTQNVLTTGVDDTIEDMMIATLPSIVTSFFYIKIINKRS